MPAHPYKVVISGRQPRNPLLAHIPHSATLIGPRQRAQILLSDEDLQRELVRLTDWHTDHLFDWVLDLHGTMFVYQLSRLVMDPERFASDADEPMAAKGQGAVYTRTTDGRPLATITPAERQLRITELYEPYHEALTATVRHMIEVRRGLYCDEATGERLPAFDGVRAALHRAVKGVF